MAILYATQVGLWENGKAEFMVTRNTQRDLEGTRVIAKSEQDAIEIYNTL